MNCVERRRRMAYAKRAIRQAVQLQGQQFPNDDSAYRGPIANMATLHLATITQQDINNAVKPFLYGWGWMGRVLGRLEFTNWESNLATVMCSNVSPLEDLRARDLATMDLADFESDIKKLYELFKGVVGKIGAAKVLHLICPNSLPPWDNNIADAVRRERKEPEIYKTEPWSKEDYYIFVQQTQTWLLKYKKTLSGLAKQCRGTPLGVLDAYLWWATHRPIYMLYS